MAEAARHSAHCDRVALPSGAEGGGKEVAGFGYESCPQSDLKRVNGLATRWTEGWVAMPRRRFSRRVR